MLGIAGWGMIGDFAQLQQPIKILPGQSSTLLFGAWLLQAKQKLPGASIVLVSHIPQWTVNGHQTPSQSSHSMWNKDLIIASVINGIMPQVAALFSNVNMSI